MLRPEHLVLRPEHLALRPKHLALRPAHLALRQDCVELRREQLELHPECQLQARRRAPIRPAAYQKRLRSELLPRSPAWRQA